MVYAKAAVVIPPENLSADLLLRNDTALGNLDPGASSVTAVSSARCLACHAVV
jgi:hypothetical protein